MPFLGKYEVLDCLNHRAFGTLVHPVSLLCVELLAENPTVDDRPLDLKSSGVVMREIQLVAPGVTETHRYLAGG